MFVAAGVTTPTPTLFFISTKSHSSFFHPPFVTVGNICNNIKSSISAKKRDDDSAQQQSQSSLKFSTPSSKLLIQSAITLFGLGFVDAGYSGDWSRIGVISKDTEELLKVLAFLVAPLCIFLLYTLSAKEKDEKSD